MLIISADDIRKVMTMRDAIESNREAFTVQSQGNAQLPERISFDVCGRGISSFMPGYVSSIPQVGVKIVSTFAENAKKNLPVVGATLLLLNPETGLVDCLIDGTELTRLRTGAISGLATELLAVDDARTGALFGTGGQALSQLEALLTVRKFREILVFDMFQERIAPFIERAAPMADAFGAKLVAASSSDEAIADADVITSVTTASTPTFDGSKVKQGVHVNGVGTYEPHKRELEETLLRRADRVFVDNMDAVMAEAGDLLIPMKERKFSREDIAGELGDLILGRVEGRASGKQITVMKTVGFATLDIVIAHHIYRKAVERGVGTAI